MALVPIVSFVDYAPVLPIPAMYYDVVSAEQRIKRICEELQRTEKYTELVSNTMNTLIEEFEFFKQTSGFDYYTETYQDALARLGVIEARFSETRALTSAEVTAIVAPYKQGRI